MHSGLATNVALRRLDPLLSPVLQRLPTQKTHLLHKPLFGRVRQPKVSVQVPDRAHDREQSVAEARMGFLERQKRFVADCHRRHGSNSLDCRFATLLYKSELHTT